MKGGLRPNSTVTSSLVNSVRPSVASTWSRWSRRYRWRMTSNSTTRPYSAAPASAASTAAANDPVAAAALAAQNAPTM
ncbi:hypothetical protein D9M68_774980 [compost metagenome]